KLAAQKAFERAVKNGTAPQEIMAGVLRYAAERDGQDQKYTKHAATWLNGGCWADEEPSSPNRHQPSGRNPAVAHLANRLNAMRGRQGASWSPPPQRRASRWRSKSPRRSARIRSF